MPNVTQSDSVPRQKAVRLLFRVWSKFYDTPLAQELFYRRIHRRILKQWRPQAGERVLDVGCGTGVFLRDLARHHAGLRLTGLDLSDAMLRVARRPLSDAKSQAPELHAGSVYEMPFQDGAFDVVLNTISCHFYTEQVRAFREIQRVTAPGGRFYCAALTSSLARVTGIHGLPGVGVWYPKQTLQRHLSQAGFKVLRSERILPNAVLFSCVKGQVPLSP